MLRLLGALLVAAAPVLAAAQSYPAKPIRLVVPWPAGGTVDGVARVMSPKLAESLGQPVIVENKPGAGGSVGAAGVARSPPDGQTLLMVFDTHAVNHHLYRNSGYDGFKLFEHVSRLVELAADPRCGDGTSRPRTRRADRLRQGESGQGDLRLGRHRQLEPPERALPVEPRRHRDGPRAVQGRRADDWPDLVGGQLNVMFVSAPQAIPQVKAGRIKALASGSPKAHPAAPRHAHTVGETLSGFEAASWVGVVVPGGTPKEIVGRLHREFIRTLEDAEVRGKLQGQGFEIVGSTPDEFLKYVGAESDKWARVIREYDIKVE